MQLLVCNYGNFYIIICRNCEKKCWIEKKIYEKKGSIQKSNEKIEIHKVFCIIPNLSGNIFHNRNVFNSSVDFLFLEVHHKPIV